MFNWIKSKTVWTGNAAILLGILESTNLTNFTDMIPEPYRPLAISVLGTIMVALRLMTTKAVKDK